MEEQEQKLTQPTKARRKVWAPRVRTGCGTCRKRKIKCDEARPSCARCRKAMLKCPGYWSDKSFTAGPQFCIPPVLCVTPQLNGTGEMRDILVLLPKINALVPAPSDDACRHMRVLIQSFMGDIPSRIGHSSAVHAATRCFAGALAEIWQHLEITKEDTMPTSLMTTRTRSRYTAALSVLSDSLNDPLHSKTIETLIAAQLLCCFETFLETAFEAATRHMFGISRIFEHMGPGRFTARHEIDMLIGQLPSIDCASYMFNSPCFLSCKGWDEILRQEEHSSLGRRRYELGAYRKAGLINTLFAETTSFMEDSKKGQYDPARHILLQQWVKHARHYYMKWHLGWMEHLSTTVSDIDTVSNIEECHLNPSTQWVGDVVGVHQATTLMFMRLPVALGCEDARQMEEQTQAFAKKLLLLCEKYKNDEKFMQPRIAALLATKIEETAHEWRQFTAQADGARSEDTLWLLPENSWKRWLGMVYIGVQRNNSAG